MRCQRAVGVGVWVVLGPACHVDVAAHEIDPADLRTVGDHLMCTPSDKTAREWRGSSRGCGQVEDACGRESGQAIPACAQYKYEKKKTEDRTYMTLAQ